MPRCVQDRFFSLADWAKRMKRMNCLQCGFMLYYGPCSFNEIQVEEETGIERGGYENNQEEMK